MCAVTGLTQLTGDSDKGLGNFTTEECERPDDNLSRNLHVKSDAGAWNALNHRRKFIHEDIQILVGLLHAEQYLVLEPRRSPKHYL